MKDRIEVQVEGELETIVEVSNLFKDLIRAKLPRFKLRHFLMDLDIFSCKPNYVSDFEDMSYTFVPFELFLHPFLG
jgi:hypothetical protein